jgi:branched-chain amino acid transport system substrate-binding protein
VALTLVLAACTQPSAPVSQPTAGPLVLGTLLPMTGGFDHVGPAEDAGVQLAVADIDKAGGVLGRPVTVIDSDSGDSFSSVASQSVDRMLAKKVDVIVGATGSAVTLTVIDKVVGAGVALVSPGDASDKLTGYPDRSLYARIVPPDL